MQIILNFDFEEKKDLNYFTNKYKTLTIDQTLFIINKGLLPDKKVDLNDNNFLLVDEYIRYYQLKTLGNLNTKAKNKMDQLKIKLKKGGLL